MRSGKCRVSCRHYILFFTFYILLFLSGCADIRIQPIVDTATPVTPTATDIPTFTPVPTNTIEWFPPTATPRPMKTPTLYPTPDELPRLGKVLLEDDFSDPEHWQTYRSPLGNAVVSNNELTLAIQGSDSIIASYSTLPQMGVLNGTPQMPFPPSSFRQRYRFGAW